MEKIKITTIKKADIELPYSGSVVLVNPVIKIEEQGLLRNVYIQSFFKDGKEGEWDEQFAEFMFRRQVLESKTNIDVTLLTIEECDEIIWGAFYDKVKSAIVNYNEVRLSINSTISNLVKKIEIENSAGFLLKGLMEKLSGFLDEIKNLTPEDIEKLKQSAQDIMDKVKQEPMASVLMDAKGNKQSKKTPKKDKGYVQ